MLEGRKCGTSVTVTTHATQKVWFLDTEAKRFSHSSRDLTESILKITPTIIWLHRITYLNKPNLPRPDLHQDVQFLRERSFLATGQYPDERRVCKLNVIGPVDGSHGKQW